MSPRSNASGAERLLQRFNALPRPLQRLARLIRNPRSPFFKPYLRFKGYRPTPVPPPTELPRQARRVYIAPVNAAEQARRWASALSDELPDLGAAYMMAPTLTGGVFKRDAPVPVGAFHLSKEWQRAEFARACEFTHVLVEAERPMFGSLFHYDVAREIAALRERGVSVAMLAHGSDVRNPAAHRRLTPWSPFHQDRPEVAALQETSDRNLKLLERLDLPTFVVTLDLLEELPRAHWCPNVAEIDRWASAARELLTEERPIVAHIPSRGWLKGSDRVDPVASALAAEGVFEYRRLSGVPQEEMPSVIGHADIVLEQFGAGAYGTTAVEAMAAGRVVVGYVLPAVRRAIEEVTGLEVPIVEATPDTLEAVLRELLADPERMRTIGARSAEFARTVHDGRLSARLLAEHWIDA